MFNNKNNQLFFGILAVLVVVLAVVVILLPDHVSMALGAAGATILNVLYLVVIVGGLYILSIVLPIGLGWLIKWGVFKLDEAIESRIDFENWQRNIIYIIATLIVGLLWLTIAPELLILRGTWAEVIASACGFRYEAAHIAYGIMAVVFTGAYIFFSNEEGRIEE